ncbi:MAG: PSD1 and planctomycete cytochrome C domain-containing protein [Verrucomicrobia bacterium]|nr:PSD1 and planctomycete cytochrome C domain-containing protein [Verrucomicrobiota bacterium]
MSLFASWIRIGLILGITAGVVEARQPVEEVDYLTQIKPILSTKCYACHGVLKQKAKLRLETRALMLKGKVIVPGKAAESLLIERILDEGDDRMPPMKEGAALKADEITLLRQWIDQGAKSPKEVIPLAPEEHWAFQIPKKSVISPNAGNPIDFLLQQQRDRLSLKTQREAPRSILLRRLYLDLIGLPPSLQQLSDKRPWEEIVNELLESPRHGERWARHWMDVWRYSDWYGLGAQLRNSQKHIWHWRDWIIESLNEDKGYDRMIEEMLAADELFPEDPKVLRATGFLARNYYLFNRTTWLDATIEHTGKAFLGLTLNCAKCHDHKYDPVTQVDYYAFRAIFEPHQVRLDPVPGETDFEKDGLPRVFDDHLEIKTFLDIRGDPKNPDKNTTIEPGVPAILASFAPGIRPVKLSAFAFAPSTRDYVHKNRISIAREKLDSAKLTLDEARKRAGEKAKQKVKTPAEPKPIEDDLLKTDKPPSFEVKDDFDKPNPKVWELIGKDWEYKDGALHLTKPTRDAAMLRLIKPHPENFELTCRYTHTGGTTYKSVTFRFDQSEDGKYENFVYTSAHAPGPKLHVAYTRNGQQTYPPAGKVSQPIKIGGTYQLRFAVRHRLINVWLDDEFVVAYKLPDRRPNGSISLSGFDATVTFDSITIRSLSDELKLISPKDSPKTDQKPKHSVELSEAKLLIVQTEIESIEATFKADCAKFRGTSKDQSLQVLINNAARKEAELAIAKANHDLLATPGDEGKVNAAKKKMKAAEEKIKAAQEGKAQYSSTRSSKKALESPAHKEADYPVVYPKTSTGRRLALAKWITSRENPLTARVAVNQVWMRHFGQPLVESVFDFGLRAKKPLQAVLLDHLAAEFMDANWSFRHLHRLMVSSKAYRLDTSTKGTPPATLAKDLSNNFYWRMNTRRMEAQLVRDSLLQLAGKLDTAMGGPSIPPGSGNRRSLYFQHSRDQQDKFLKMFNDADHLQCYRRSESVVPQQALAMSNSKLAIEIASAIAAQLSQASPKNDQDAFVEKAFQTLLGRDPDELERKACTMFIEEISQLLSKGKGAPSATRIHARLVHALLNHNDFISIR